jgi:hypothetical protein
VGHNNPAEQAFLEAGNIWPGLRIDCFVSLGTGRQKIVHMDGRWKKVTEACEKMVRDCEYVHRAMYQSQLHRNMDYFRFDVARGMDEFDMREWTESGSASCISAITSGYLLEPEVMDSLDLCIRTLIGEIAFILR